MSTRAGLPVFQTVADIFAFTFKKFPSLFVLTLVSAVIAEPLTFLCLQLTGSFADLAALQYSSLFTDRSSAPLAASWLGLSIALLGVLLFFALSAVPIIRHLTHGERLWLIRINTSSPRYILSQLPVILILLGIILLVLTATTAFVGVVTNTPQDHGVMTFLLLLPVIITLAYFGVRLSLVPVAAVARGSLNIYQGLALTKNNGFRLLSIILIIALPLLLVGLVAMDVVLQLYATDQNSLSAVSEPQESQIFNGGPRQIIELYSYTYSKPAFIAANAIVFLFLAFAAGSLLSAPAIVYRKLIKASAAVLICILLAPLQHAMASDRAENASSLLRTLIPTVAYGTTFYLHDSDGRTQFYKGFFSNLAITYSLKKTVTKTRPNGNDNESFPSGHTSVAFQGAAFIHRRYGLKYALPAYLGSSYVAWNRVDSDHHFTIDVLAGAAVGMASSFIFTQPYKGFVVTPVASNGFYGVGISKQW